MTGENQRFYPAEVEGFLRCDARVVVADGGQADGCGNATQVGLVQLVAAAFLDFLVSALGGLIQEVVEEDDAVGAGRLGVRGPWTGPGGRARRARRAWAPS